MLQAIATSAEAIFAATMKEERSKKHWRNFFIILFNIFLVIALTSFIVGIILDSTREDFNLSTEVVVGAFVYLLANIFAVINLMAKYVHNTQYLKIFKTVSTGLLDYLAKGSTTNKSETYEDDISET